MLIKSRRVAAVVLAGLLACGAAGAAMMPDFGGSVTFDKKEFDFRMSDLGGKMVVVVFFQSWCPICNKWSGDLFSQIEKKYASDRSVALVAIKTDGGGVSGAKAYLKGRTDVGSWLVAADANATYYKQVNGKDELYGYAIVSPAGELAAKGKAGMFYQEGGKKAFTLARDDLKAKHGAGAKAFLPAGKEYPKPLAAAVKAAEAGNFRAAMLACMKLGRLPEAKALRAEILDALEARVKAWAADLADTASKTRFTSYMSLRKVAAELRGTAPAKTASAAMRGAKKDKAIKRELEAEATYLGIMAAARNMRAKQRAQALPPALAQVGAKYAGTHYGGIAEAEARKPGSD